MELLAVARRGMSDKVGLRAPERRAVRAGHTVTFLVLANTDTMTPQGFLRRKVGLQAVLAEPGLLAVDVEDVVLQPLWILKRVIEQSPDA
jgi:hypothetical protein